MNSSEQLLEEAIVLPSIFNEICDASREWTLQCGLQKWALSVDAANLDSTAIGEVFGEHVKSLVRGAGSLELLIDHRQESGEVDPMTILRLTLRKINATAMQNFICTNRNETTSQIKGSAYYQCDLLLTNTRINVQANDFITGTADFVGDSLR